MKRLFIAIHHEPTENLLSLLNQLKVNLSNDQINWVRPENMHLTLKFLGETPAQKIPLLSKRLLETAQRNKPFQVQFDRTGIFGSRYDPRVIWLGTQHTHQAMAQLAEDVLETLSIEGFSRDRQNFVPHLTLGRVKRLTDKKHFQAVVQAIPQRIYLESAVDQFILFESILRKEGPVYQVLQCFGLGKTD